MRPAGSHAASAPEVPSVNPARRARERELYLRRQKASVERQLRASLRAARAAEEELATLGDAVRYGVEQRMSIGADDPAAWGDPVYALLLDLLTEVGACGRKTASVLQAWEELSRDVR